MTKERIKQGIHVPIHSADGTRYVLTVQDGWSRFCQLYLLKEAKVANVIHVLTDSFIAVFGCPAKIRTDHGSQFTSDAFTQWTESLSIRMIPEHNLYSIQQHLHAADSVFKWRCVLLEDQIDWHSHISSQEG